MRGSTERILTTHVGSLPRPDDLVALNAEAVGALTRGETVDDRQRTDRLRSAVVEVVQKQRELGIDIVNDGEFGKATVGRVDYGAWQSYAYERLTGWEPGDMSNTPRPTQVDLGRAAPGGVPDRKERQMAEFEDFYQELARSSPTSLRMAFTGPISYRGQALIERDIAGLRERLDANGQCDVDSPDGTERDLDIGMEHVLEPRLRRANLVLGGGEIAKRVPPSAPDTVVATI